jgi:hypothetical protein
MPAFFVFAPGDAAIESERRLYFLFLLFLFTVSLPEPVGAGITCAAGFRAKCSKIAQILQIFPILLTVQRDTAGQRFIPG